MTNKTVKPKRKVDKVRIGAIIVSVIVAIGFIGVIVGLVIMFNMLSTKPEVKVEDFVNEQSSIIYDRNNEPIAEIGYVRRENITYDDLPNVVIDAFVATEDSRFFSHPGFDVSRFVRAILENLKSMSFSQGGSTFTMQLVKNTYFVNDETGQGAAIEVERKVQEIAMSFEVENILSKKVILESYLNKINFGGEGNIRGIEKAANYYFGKSVTELNLNEAAFLAGVINAPSANNPYYSIENANERKNTVLYLMNRHGYISDSEYELAVKVRVEDLLNDQTDGDEGDNEEFKYQAYIDAVIEEVIEETGYDPSTTPMHIYTNMDQDLQSLIDDIQRGEHGITYPNDLIEIASSVVNNHTGAVVGIMGGRNYADGGALMLNHATAQYKQPGSSIKVMLDYALAFENLGWATSHVVTDQPVTIDGNVSVGNSDGVFSGQMRLFDAIGFSKNTPAVQALQEVANTMGRAYIVEYLNNLGFDVTQDEFNLQYSFGASTFEVSTLQLASAQSTLFNGGTHVEPHTVRRIEFMDGRDAIDIESESTKALSEQAAYLCTEALRNNVNGAYWYMSVLRDSYQTFAKTGTSDWGDSGLAYGIPKGAAKDSWMIASSSEYTIATWLGYEKAIKGENTYMTLSIIDTNITGRVNNLLLDQTVESFGTPENVSRPSGISSITHILGTWPYASTIEGMDQQYVTTGLIKSSEASLVSPESAGVESLSGSITATMVDSNNGTIEITWPQYPDTSKLTVYQDKKGKDHKLFDYSWIFGPVQYKADISVNGQTATTVGTANQTDRFQINASAGDTVQVCGYYAYENSNVNPARSNSSCVTITIENTNVSLSIPNATATQTQLDAFLTQIASYGATVTPSDPIPTSDPALANHNVIYFNGSDVTGQTITRTSQEIANGTWIVTKYELIE